MEFTEVQINEVMKAAKLISRQLDESMRADDDIDISATALTNDMQFEIVKPGRRLILTHLSGYNSVSACTFIRVGYWNGHRFNWLKTEPAPLISETVAHNGEISLREGMYPIVRFEGCTILDDIHAALNGYWIKT